MPENQTRSRIGRSSAVGREVYHSLQIMLETLEYVRPSGHGANQHNCLAVVRFGDTRAEGTGPALDIHVALDALNGPAPLELWRASGTVRAGNAGEIRYAADDRHLMGIVECEESAVGGIRQAAEFAYTQIRAFQRQSQFPAILRIWNYLDAINEGTADTERYRQFSVGRASGFTDTGADQFPAASAIGRQKPTGHLQVYWVAGRVPGRPVENPRQVSAYRYPREYGPVSPGFARAMSIPEGGLFVSGTASIVGHASQHAGNVAAQLQETLRNLAAVKSHARIDMSNAQAQTLLKVYVRHAEDAPSIERTLEQLWPREQMILLGADICRRELLLEIESVVRAAECSDASATKARDVASA
jgi:chorismate lyase/3-hydroxybenzoate synthase